jgi:hypothetical protein
MKKYFIASVVAIMAFAFAAFAATLNVNGGTLQAGMDTDLACFDDAALTYGTGYAQNSSHTADGSDSSPEERFHVTEVTVSLSGGDEDCINGNLRGHLKVNDGNRDRVGPHGYAILPFDEVNTASGTASFTVKVNKDSLLVTELLQVQVMVKEFANSGEEEGYRTGVFAVAGD